MSRNERGEPAQPAPPTPIAPPDAESIAHGNASASTPVDPFDLDALRVAPDSVSAISAVEELDTVSVRKPKPTEYFRTHPDYGLDTVGFEPPRGDSDFDGQLYLVYPAARTAMVVLLGDLPVFRLYLCWSLQGHPFIWPCKMPRENGRGNQWANSRLVAAEAAKTRWVRVIADMSMGKYRRFVAEGDIPDPKWPNRSFGELIHMGFADYKIEHPDHPVIKRLRGRVNSGETDA